MSENQPIYTLVVERGTFMLGMKTTNGDGEVIKDEPQKWTAGDGNSIIVTGYDLDNDEQIGDAALFPKWDGVRIADQVIEMLGIERNFPTPEGIYKMLKESDYNIDFCEDICGGYYEKCRECPLECIKDIQEESA